VDLYRKVCGYSVKTLRLSCGRINALGLFGEVPIPFRFGGIDEQASDIDRRRRGGSP
jgi:hypothetical protein